MATIKRENFKTESAYRVAKVRFYAATAFNLFSMRNKPAYRKAIRKAIASARKHQRALAGVTGAKGTKIGKMPMRYYGRAFAPIDPAQRIDLCDPVFHDFTQQTRKDTARWMASVWPLRVWK